MISKDVRSLQLANTSFLRGLDDIRAGMKVTAHTTRNVEKLSAYNGLASLPLNGTHLPP